MTEKINGLFTAFHPNDRLLRLVEETPEIAWKVAFGPEDVRAHIDQTEVLLLNNRLCNADMGAALCGSRSKTLSWIHFVSAGVEMGIAMGLPSNIPISCAAATNGPVLAEHAIALLLGCLRRFPDIHRAQVAHEWRRFALYESMRSLEESCICIIGLGAVGREVARKLRAFDAEVIAVSRAGTDPGVSKVFARENLAQALGQADAVIICTNSDATSRHLIGADAIAAMKNGAYIINIARGEIIDERAMIEALRDGKLAGAGLDVAETEPPEPDNPLWEIDTVILSPHVSGGGSGERTHQRQKLLFLENLRRFRKGEQLLNLVNTGDGKYGG